MIWCNRLSTLGTMTAILAHEYNNLLTPIGSYAQLALANPEDDELMRKALQTSIDGVARARAVGEATLQFARPDDPDQSETGSVRDAIEQATACLSQALHCDGIELEIEVPDVCVGLKTVQIQQVLVNLMDNARKAMAGQSRPRTLIVRGKEKEAGVQIEVIDNGPGIDEGILDDVFKAFVTKSQADQPGEGTGLGLRVCKDLIEAAGGWIQVESSPGQGSTFRFWLARTSAMRH